MGKVEMVLEYFFGGGNCCDVEKCENLKLWNLNKFLKFAVNPIPTLFLFQIMGLKLGFARKIPKKFSPCTTFIEGTNYLAEGQV